MAAIKASQLYKFGCRKKRFRRHLFKLRMYSNKNTLRSSEIYDYLKNSSNYGLDAKNIVPKIADIIKKSRKVAEKLSKGIDFFLKKIKLI